MKGTMKLKDILNNEIINDGIYENENPLYSFVNYNIKELSNPKISKEEIKEELTDLNNFLNENINSSNPYNKALAMRILPLLSNVFSIDKFKQKEVDNNLTKVLNSEPELSRSLFGHIMDNILIEYDDKKEINIQAASLSFMYNAKNLLKNDIQSKVKEKIYQELRDEYGTELTDEEFDSQKLSLRNKMIEDKILDIYSLSKNEDGEIIDIAGLTIDDQKIKDFKKEFSNELLKEKELEVLQELYEKTDKEIPFEDYAEKRTKEIDLIKNKTLENLLNYYNDNNEMNKVFDDNEFALFHEGLSASLTEEETVNKLKEYTNNFKNIESDSLIIDEVKQHIESLYGESKDWNKLENIIEKKRIYQEQNILTDLFENGTIEFTNSNKFKAIQKQSEEARIKALEFDNQEDVSVNALINEYYKKHNLKTFRLFEQKKNKNDLPKDEKIVDMLLCRSVMQYNEFGTPISLKFTDSLIKKELRFTQSSESDPVALEAALFHAKAKGWKKLYLDHNGNEAMAMRYIDSMLHTIVSQEPRRLYDLDDVVVPKKFAHLLDKYKESAILSNEMPLRDDYDVASEEISSVLEQQGIELPQQEENTEHEIEKNEKNNNEHETDENDENEVTKNDNENKNEETQLNTNSENEIKLDDGAEEELSDILNKASKSLEEESLMDKYKDEIKQLINKEYDLDENDPEYESDFNFNKDLMFDGKNEDEIKEILKEKNVIKEDVKQKRTKKNKLSM